MSLECPHSGGYEVHCVNAYDTTGEWAEVPASDCKGSPSASKLNSGGNGHCSGAPTGTFKFGNVYGGGWHRGALYKL